MKRISRIILSIWIICGLAAGNAYSFTQSYGIRNSINTNAHLKKSESDLKGISSECHNKHSDALLECENELEDDNEKLFSESFSIAQRQIRRCIYLGQYRYSKYQKRSNTLNILYCVFRI